MNMTFGSAIKSLKKGKQVARKGWSDKAMYLFLNKGLVNAAYVLEEESAGEPILEFIDGIKSQLFDPLMGDAVTIIPSIGMRGETGSVINGWCPSQNDMFAEDWFVVE